ncbi:unnamed protein product [Clonostachys rhizophaga]|uniref:Zn(2)-C6 fungal-type domain-containing protein n=1 Tax=Clonostachys rhizophaga TaxID=160324 RepID=A0A9N9VS61_9HYPO|nr:unnamed protein product [Clonostachys rhizophaga]
MPRVAPPRTTYCQHCKRRRVKCDQQWPTCSACRRAQLVCPGPTSMIKFVHNETQTVNDETGGNIMQSSASSIPRGGGNGDGRVIVARPSSLVKTYQNGSVARSFRLVNSRPSMTPSDRVASLLVAMMNLDSESVNIAAVLLGRLRERPPRLSESACLRDAVAHKCANIKDMYLGLQTPSLSTLKLYGKALRSLQQALNGPEALSVETFAAGALIHDQQRKDHIEGMLLLMKARSPPKLDDQVEVDIAAHCYVGVRTYKFLYGKIEFLESQPWKAAMDEVIQRTSGFDFDDPMGILMTRYQEIWPGWVQDARLISRDPDTFKRKAKGLTAEFLVSLSELQELEAHDWESIAAEGKIREISDPDFFVGRSYEVDDLEPALILLDSLPVQLIIIRMAYDFAILNAKRYTTSRLFKLTFEAAEKRDQEHLMDIVEYLDCVPLEPGQDRTEVLTDLITREAKIFSGRLVLES